MLQQIKEMQSKSWFKTALTTVATGIGLVASIIGLWVLFQGSVKDSVTAGMETITFEVRRNTRDVIEIFADDLHTRKRVLDREIEAMERSGLLEPQEQIILERKKSHRDDMIQQIREIENKWPNANF